MKRLKPIISSDSDSEDLSKIKDEFKKSKKISLKENSKKGIKRLKSDVNQMSIEDSFKKVATQKRKVEPCLDNFIKKIPIIQNRVESDSFLNSSNDVPEISSSLDIKKKNISSFSSLPTIPKLASNTSSILLESTLKIKKKESKSSTSAISSKKSSIKSNVVEGIDCSSKKSPIKSNIVDDTLISSPGPAKAKVAYAQYMHRGGPQALGTKEVPEGSPNCLIGKTFVITGVLDSIERDDAQALIERHGGKVTKAVSGRTTYLVVGQEPGESKVNKANKLKTKQINEDELFELIRSFSSKITQNLKSSNSKETLKKSSKVKESSTKSETINKMSGDAIINKSDNMKTSMPSSILFVEKYSPTSLKQLIGQQGDRSPANKLLVWLKNFDKNLNSDCKTEEDGSSFRAALLSGPPGIGKTTTARLVCKLLGYNVVELNASSVRSKNNIQKTLSESLVTTPFFNNKGLKHCVIMDEVDGMAGNEDRGGINELIHVIKTTKHPIICICNDRQSRKLQSFAKYVYDLRYRQLTVDNMRAAITTIIEKEGLSLPDDVLNFIIRSSNFDMRQVLNNLQMWSSGSLESETVKADAKSAIKEFKLGPFDIIGKVFSHEGVKTISDKSDLFFYDYQLGGLFVQENYPLVRPYMAKGDMARTMKLMSLAADSISMGDIVSTKIRSTNNWGLLPTQAMFSSVIPGEYLHGRLSARIQFPSFLGKCSKGNKNYRILSFLCSHIFLSTRGGVFNSSTISMDYGELLVKKLVAPLREANIEKVLMHLEDLQLMKEDMDLLIEVMSWSHLPNLLASINTQIKSSLTRSYNKSNFKLPYAIITVKKSLKSLEPSLDQPEEDDNDEEDDIDEDDITKDTMITKKGKISKIAGSKVLKGGKSSTKKSEEPKERKVTKRAKK